MLGKTKQFAIGKVYGLPYGNETILFYCYKIFKRCPLFVFLKDTPGNGNVISNDYLYRLVDRDKHFHFEYDFKKSKYLEQMTVTDVTFDIHEKIAKCPLIVFDDEGFEQLLVMLKSNNVV